METEPIFKPTYINLEYFFGKILELIKDFFNLFTDLHVPSWIFIIFSIFAIFFITIILYSSIRIYEIQKEEQKKLKEIIVTNPQSNAKNPRWEKVKMHMLKDSSAEWRMAIIESDLILEEMVTRMGYKGETLAEKLKIIEKSDFNTIQLAWEAHLVRNRIAHEGGDYNLSRHEAVRIIALFEEVFKEFDFI